MPARRGLKQVVVAAPLLSAAFPAAAHGIEGLIQSIVIAALIVGLLVGVVAGALDSNPGKGLLSAIGVLSVGEVLYVFISVGLSPDLLGILGMMFTLVTFAGVIPLVIAFFIGFGGATICRARFWPGQRKNEPAP
jgi:hypothetical protein